MIQNGTNILDQLLGGFETKPTGSPAGTPAVDSGMASFVDLLGLLVAGRDSQILTDPNAIAAASDTPGGDGTNESTAVVEPFAALIAGSFAGKAQAETGSEAAPAEIPADAVPQSKNGAAFKTFDAISMNPNIRTLLGQSANELQSAAYKILDARIVDDNLELTVAGDNDTAAPVRISVPAELLRQPQQIELLQSAGSEKTGSRLAGQLATVPGWDSTPGADYKLDDLLSRVNLKALEIRLEPSAQNNTAAPSKVALNFVAEMGGQQLILKNKLDSQKIDIRKTDNSSGTVQPQIGQSSPTGSKALTGVTPTQSESHSSPRPVAVPSKNTSANSSFDLLERLAGGTGKAASQQTMVAGELTSPRLGSQNKSLDLGLQQVRLYLPEQFQPQLKAQSQTLMLKIEPASLGPAKLNLVMRQDGLTARVTVETPMAKAAVEGSLDQLTQQLSRAGVQVHRIEVALDGGGMRNQFFDRRPEWSYQQGRSSSQYARESESEQVTSSTVLTPPEYGYLRIDGVNLLA